MIDIQKIDRHQRALRLNDIEQAKNLVSGANQKFGRFHRIGWVHHRNHLFVESQTRHHGKLLSRR